MDGGGPGPTHSGGEGRQTAETARPTQLNLTLHLNIPASHVPGRNLVREEEPREIPFTHMGTVQLPLS